MRWRAGSQFDPAVVAAFDVTSRPPALGAEESRPAAARQLELGARA